MSEATPNTKYQALQFAAQHLGESPDDVVKRANAYHKFLSGVATATAPQPATSAKGDTSATGTSGKGNTAAATPPKNTANKPAAGAANKPAGAAANKPAAGAAANKPAATKQNVGAAAGAFPPDDTKAPGAKNDFAAMCKKLRAVMQDSTNGGKTEASRILAEDGNGAKSVRDLDPTFYDAVVEACENVLNPGAGGDDGETGGEGSDDSDLGL